MLYVHTIQYTRRRVVLHSMHTPYLRIAINTHLQKLHGIIHLGLRLAGRSRCTWQCMETRPANRVGYCDERTSLGLGSL